MFPGLKVPEAATNALNMAGTTAMAPNPPQHNMPPIATQCFMLSNMFDPMLERDPNWDQEIRDDVIEECNKHGGVLHIYVDKASSQVPLLSDSVLRIRDDLYRIPIFRPGSRVEKDPYPDPQQKMHP